MPKQESPADAMRRQRTRLQTEFAPDAITALWEVARDPTAPPAARATAGTTLIRAAGFFDRSEAGKLEKEIHEMTLEELDERRRELQAESERPHDGDEDDDDGDDRGGGIFD